jgi:hypothetical protein
MAVLRAYHIGEDLACPITGHHSSTVSVGFSPNFLPLGAITKIKLITIFTTKKAKCPLRRNNKRFSNENDRYDPHQSLRGREANIVFDFVRYTNKRILFLLSSSLLEFIVEQLYKDPLLIATISNSLSRCFKFIFYFLYWEFSI